MKETIEKGQLAGIPKDKMFFINIDSLKIKNGGKFSLQNYGIKVINSNLDLLNTKYGKCSIANLNKISHFKELKVDSSSNKSFINIYPNLKNTIALKKFSILCFWSTYYTKKQLLSNVSFAKETKKKCSDCQVLYINADFYKELK